MEGVFSFSFEGQRLIHNYPPKTTALGGGTLPVDCTLCSPCIRGRQQLIHAFAKTGEK